MTGLNVVPALALAFSSTVTAVALTPDVSAADGASAPDAKVQATYNRRHLIVVGTSHADRVRVIRRAHAVVVKVNGKQISFGKRIKPTKLVSIKLRGLRGDDRLVLVEKAGPLPAARLQGGQGNDVLIGGSGKSSLLGRSGDDLLRAGAGPATLLGGGGNDRLQGAGGTSTMNGESGDDVLTAGTGATVMDGGDGADRLTGGPGTTKMNGSAGADVLTGGAGPTTMSGGGDEDVMTGGDGVTTMVGGGAQDTMAAGHGRTNMEGGSAADTMTGGSGVTDMKGEEGRDVMTGGTGPTTMSGGIGNDVLVGGSNVNDLDGDDGDDDLVGGPLTDHLVGGPGADTFVQSAGSDQLVGGQGSDVYRLDADGPGGVVGLVEQATDGVDRVELLGSLADLTLDLGSGAVQVLSPTLSVKLSQPDSFDSVTTAAGEDDLRGNELANVIAAGSEDDVIEGRGGDDVLTGAAGSDTFVYRKAGAADLLGEDKVTDFGVGLDTVNLSGLTVKSGLGTATVVVWDGATDFGTITSTNGHLWGVGDFS